MAGRATGRALALLRRSTDRQEKSLAQQLDWAIHKASELGLRLEGTQADLERMQRQELHVYKDLYVDDAIPGSNLKRPGLTAARSAALKTRSISHLLVYLPDRFARPEEPLEAAMMEIELLRAGLTVVFSNRTSSPRQRGVNYFAENVQLLYQYTEAGEYLNLLAQRVIDGQIKVARQGGWTGGRPPYGHVRVLVDAQGNVVQELAKGMKIRMAGCHVKIMPKDMDKIRVWLLILEWYHKEEIGVTKIAKRLNGLGIPSPDAGRTRKDNGVRHKVSGLWGSRTVLELIRNAAIVGWNRYGVQSEGRHRRLGKERARLLNDSDTKEDGSPKVIRNADDLIISKPTGFLPSADQAVFQACQELLAKRGKSLRGISRRDDPTRYPLALRVWDMTENCGHPMYGITSGNRAIYLCGRYKSTAGAACEHNAVDGEAALQFVLGALKQQVQKVGGAEALRERLKQLAEQDRTREVDDVAATLVWNLKAAVTQAEDDLRIITHNLARAKNEAVAQAIEQEFNEQQKQLDRLNRDLAKARSAIDRAPAAVSIDEEVEGALVLYEELQAAAADASARQSLRQLFKKINLRLWLSFDEGRKGKRKVRLLKGGVLTTGDAEPPVRPYGNDGVGSDGPSRSDPGTVPVAAGATETPSVSSESSSEGISLPIEHRGDWI